MANGTTAQWDERAESLLLAERRSLEMIAGGARLPDILADICGAIDAQDPCIISTVLLMDPDGKHLWPAAGPRVPRVWTQALAESAGRIADFFHQRRAPRRLF